MKDRITDKEWEKYNQRKLDSNDLYELKIKRVTDEELNSFTEDDNKASYLYYLMNKGYSLKRNLLIEKFSIPHKV